MGRSLLVFTALACGLFSGTSLPAATVHAEAPSLTFYSTLTEEAFAMLRADGLDPATTRHGPFQVPAPGLSVRNAALSIADLRCTADDWRQVVAAVAAWNTSSSKIALRLVANDGRVFVFSTPPTARDGLLFGRARLLAADGRPARVLLRVAHDGQATLVIHASPTGSAAPDASPDASLSPASNPASLP